MGASLPTLIKSVLQCNLNNTVHLQSRSLRLRHLVGRLCLPCFGILIFQKGGENVNSGSYEYCEVLLTLRDSIRRRRPGQLTSSARATQERLQELQRQLLEHPAYSPDLAPSDFHLFGSLETTLVANVSLLTKRLERKRGSG
jgi:hypothetical protein